MASPSSCGDQRQVGQNLALRFPMSIAPPNFQGMIYGIGCIYIILYYIYIYIYILIYIYGIIMNINELYGQLWTYCWVYLIKNHIGNMETTLVAHLRTTKLDGGRIEHATQCTCNAWISREDPPETS
jgi:hypothetical protein